MTVMIEAVAMSGSSVRSQQIGEAELTFGERRAELMQQYRSRPLVFMEKYHVCIISMPYLINWFLNHSWVQSSLLPSYPGATFSL